MEVYGKTAFSSFDLSKTFPDQFRSKSGHANCTVCDRDCCSLVYKEPEGTEGNTEQSGAILGDT